MVKQLTKKEIAERKAFFRDRLKCCKPEGLHGMRITEVENWIDRILDELTENRGVAELLNMEVTPESIETNLNKECEFFSAKKENGCKQRPIFDPETEGFLGFLACEVIKDCPYKSKNKVFATAEETREAFLNRNLQLPKVVQIDEVAHAFFNSSRVESWEVLGEEYAGHKIGAIYSFVLGLIEKHIGESMCIKREQFVSKGEV